MWWTWSSIGRKTERTCLLFIYLVFYCLFVALTLNSINHQFAVRSGVSLEATTRGGGAGPIVTTVGAGAGGGVGCFSGVEAVGDFETIVGVGSFSLIETPGDSDDLTESCSLSFVEVLGDFDARCCCFSVTETLGDFDDLIDGRFLGEVAFGSLD